MHMSVIAFVCTNFVVKIFSHLPSSVANTLKFLQYVMSETAAPLCTVYSKQQPVLTDKKLFTVNI